MTDDQGELLPLGPAAKAAIPALTELLKDKSKKVREAAQEALKKIKAVGE